MPDPKDLDDYNMQYNGNTRYEGRGPDTMMIVPCPFCCAPDFMKWAVWPGHPQHIEVVLQAGATCTSCKRSMRGIIERNAAGTQITTRMVQTGGDDPPPYIAALGVMPRDETPHTS